MNTVKILSLLTGVFLFAQTATAQVEAAISKEYSNDEIVQMIKKYKRADSHDVIAPETLRQKFVADFPRARNVEWETDGSVYEVEFNVRARDYEAYYDSKGNLLMFVYEIPRSELPAAVRKAAESKYPKYSFENIDKIRRGSETFYKIEMERRSSGVEVELLTGENGEILKEKFD
jgi:hypothetical protein